MPIIWRYLLRHYLRVLCLAVVSFLVVLFVSRLRQLAQFALLGSGIQEVVRFALFLIPYVLPIALPISCLVGALLLFSRLSSGHELVALRAAGLGLRHIVTPLLLAATALTLVNFYIASELATHCHLLGTRMKSDRSAVNPFRLLQNTALLPFGESFVTMRTVRAGKEAKAVALAFNNPVTECLTLLTADRMWNEEHRLCAHHLSAVIPHPKPEGFDSLLIENYENTWADASSLEPFFSAASWNPKNHYLRLRLLLLRLAQNRGNQVQIDKIYAEMGRRTSLALAIFTFTLLGCAFGIALNQRTSTGSIIKAMSLSIFLISCYFAAGELGGLLPVALALYFVPHMLLIALSIRRLRCAAQGLAA